jgi:hypothetical protein
MDFRTGEGLRADRAWTSWSLPGLFLVSSKADRYANPQSFRNPPQVVDVPLMPAGWPTTTVVPVTPEDLPTADPAPEAGAPLREPVVVPAGVVDEGS